ncbi:MAG: peptidoglycan DD-metalloendopeptidase family protein [Bacteroidota bacterium]|nr:peptidoglycan DD-metalloendopeptidase family protein [Bacteroidota bacterium]
MKLKTTILFFTVAFPIAHIFGQLPSFTLPVQGTLGTDFYIVNHVDQNLSVGQFKDFNCGSKSYDGHMGTDFVLRSFRQMDSGVNVLAAEAGIVVAVVDTFYDRNKTGNSLGFGNYICIKHSGKYFTYYAHLKTKSFKVKKGDNIKQGQVIALVGSSGNSTDPHVHFEVWYDSASLIDPFAGNCQTLGGLWKSQPVYDTVHGIIETGLVNIVPTIDILRERPVNKYIYGINDSIVCHWALQKGVHPGDSSRTDWYDPQGKLYYTYSFGHNTQDYWYYYWFSYIYRPVLNGFYTYKYYYNNSLNDSGKFEVRLNNNITLGNNLWEITIQNLQDFVIVNMGNIESISYSLYDIAGKLIYNNTIKTHQIALDRNLYSGFYILSIQSRNSNKSFKLVL